MRISKNFKHLKNICFEYSIDANWKDKLRKSKNDWRLSSEWPNKVRTYTYPSSHTHPQTYQNALNQEEKYHQHNELSKTIKIIAAILSKLHTVIYLIGVCEHLNNKK